MKSDAPSPSTASPAKSCNSSGAGRPRPSEAARRGKQAQGAPELPASAARHALFLDVDGTLLSIAAHPEAVQVPEPLLALLDRLKDRLQGAVALVSGRTIADLDRLFVPLQLPSAGIHGLERRGADGVVRRSAEAGPLDVLRAPLADFVKTRDGLLLEDKRQSLALHYRNAPDCESEIKSFLDKLLRATASPLELKRGKMVVEIKPAGTDKGTAIEAFMEEAPFAGRIPVFIGDDVTDEDGFQAVNRMGGLSIRVGVDKNSAATCSLPDEEAVMAWLRLWATDRPEGETH